MGSVAPPDASSFAPPPAAARKRVHTLAIAKLQYCRRSIMPKIKTSGVKYPDGWELIEPTLSELHSRMREGQFGWPSGIASAVYALWRSQLLIMRLYVSPCG
ncbi:hypothetical protein QYE76_003002 [Lolium multiflorum]|uniref:Uncharacterized protein n=1 Tax=Lolium multiflorum TaxID=4521 RepID=A0AAD8RQ22_LOLMU|nr:hypothetical protein QYE76_003002 [Lolium multiflorum]